MAPKSRSSYKRVLLNTFIFLSVFLLSCFCFGCGCGPAEEGKTEVTILYINDFAKLEKLVEDTYPDIDLKCERTPYPGEQLRRLQKGVAPDLLVFTQPSSDEMTRYLLDISDTKASTAYDGTIMQQLAHAGRTYLLPLPGQYCGYIVNETLFESAGIGLPSDIDELIDALARMKDAGIGVGVDGTNFAFKSDYNTDLGMFYTALMVPDFLGTMDGVRWLDDFGDKKASMEGVWEPAFEITDRMVAAGILDAAPLAQQRNTIRYGERMGNGSMAAVFGTSSLYSEFVEENAQCVSADVCAAYSYKMLPLLGKESSEPWLMLSPSAYIGINAAAESGKTEACKRVLELLSTNEGQAALIEDMRMGISYLRGYETDDAYVPEGLGEYLKKGAVYNVHFPDKILEYLGSNARKVFAGKMTAAEALSSVDKYYREGSESIDYDLSVVGALDKDLLLQNFNVRRGETELGNFIADGVAEASGASIAVVNGGGIRGSFYRGDVYGSDLAAVCPFDNRIVVLDMSGKTMAEMIENSLSTCTDDFPGGRFLQVSGIHYTFDSSAPAGSRLKSVRLADGTNIDPMRTYRVAVNDYMAGKQGYAEGNGDGFVMLNVYDENYPRGNVILVNETDKTYSEALAVYFKNHLGEILSSSLEGRIEDTGRK